MFRNVKTVIVWLILVGNTALPVTLFGQTDSGKTGSVTATADTGASGTVVTPVERVRLALASGQKLKNPYTDNPEAIAEGRHYWLSTCAPCHGDGGGGGMCPPLINEVWVYGSDDDVLFKLITLGSVELQKLGYTRLRTETIVGPMPPFGNIIKSDELLWKVLAYVRSAYRGDPAKRNW